MSKVKITREQFEAYESVRESGITNMMAVDSVCAMSGLTREECFHIMNNYSELKAKFA